METLRLEDRIILTSDGNYRELISLPGQFGGRIHAVKLGMSFLWSPRVNKKGKNFKGKANNITTGSQEIHRVLASQGIDMILDAKLHEDPDQMKHVVDTLVGRSDVPNFRKITVTAAAPTESLIAAQETVGDSKIVASLSDSSSKFFGLELENLDEANRQLENPIETVMCSGHDVARVKSAGHFMVIATGIRLPGQEQNDHSQVVTPFEALQAGADWLSIGRSVTQGGDSIEQMNAVLENARGNG